MPHLVTKLTALAAEKTVVLLDYETNQNINDTSQPLSCAGLIVDWIKNRGVNS